MAHVGAVISLNTLSWGSSPAQTRKEEHAAVVAAWHSAAAQGAAPGAIVLQASALAAVCRRPATFSRCMNDGRRRARPPRAPALCPHRRSPPPPLPATRHPRSPSPPQQDYEWASDAGLNDLLAQLGAASGSTWRCVRQWGEEEECLASAHTRDAALLVDQAIYSAEPLAKDIVVAFRDAGGLLAGMRDDIRTQLSGFESRWAGATLSAVGTGSGPKVVLVSVHGKKTVGGANGDFYPVQTGVKAAMARDFVSQMAGETRGAPLLLVGCWNVDSAPLRGLAGEGWTSSVHQCPDAAHKDALASLRRSVFCVFSPVWRRRPDWLPRPRPQRPQLPQLPSPPVLPSAGHAPRQRGLRGGRAVWRRRTVGAGRQLAAAPRRPRLALPAHAAAGQVPGGLRRRGRAPLRLEQNAFLEEARRPEAPPRRRGPPGLQGKAD